MPDEYEADHEYVHRSDETDIVYECHACDGQITVGLGLESSAVKVGWKLHEDIPMTKAERAVRKNHIRRNFDNGADKTAPRARQIIRNFATRSGHTHHTCPKCNGEPEE